jgi:hypothetical protein
MKSSKLKKQYTHPCNFAILMTAHKGTRSYSIQRPVVKNIHNDVVNSGMSTKYQNFDCAMILLFASLDRAAVASTVLQQIFRNRYFGQTNTGTAWKLLAPAASVNFPYACLQQQKIELMSKKECYVDAHQRKNSNKNNKKQQILNKNNRTKSRRHLGIRTSDETII